MTLAGRPARRLAAALAIAAIGTLAPASADAPAAVRPKAEKALRADLAKVEARLADLIVKSKQDKRITLIELYLSWSDPAQYSSPKREVSAKDLVTWMSDENAPEEVQLKARDALLDSTGRSFNPDLSTAKGKRAKFSLDQLVPLLDAKGEVGRRSGFDVLDKYWYPSDPAIRRYNAQDPATWKPAKDAFRKLLSPK